MPLSQNGFPAWPTLVRRKLVVNGVEFIGGIVDDDDVATVLGYVLEQFDKRVERLRNPGCWGFSYRENRNDPNSLSNHSSGTAVDANAPQHPNGVPTASTFLPGDIAEIHRILAEVDHTVRWGGDYTRTPDAMHFEINTSPSALAVVAKRIREGDDMPYTPDELTALVKAAVRAELDDATTEPADAKIPNTGDDGPKSMSLKAILWRIMRTLDRIETKLTKLLKSKP